MDKLTEGTTKLHMAKAAQELQTTEMKVLMLLKNKALLGEEIDGEWYVYQESLECFKAHGKDMKVEAGCKTYCSSGGCGCH
jgi:hypothetical protein